MDPPLRGYREDLANGDYQGGGYPDEPATGDYRTVAPAGYRDDPLTGEYRGTAAGYRDDRAGRSLCDCASCAGGRRTACLAPSVAPAQLQPVGIAEVSSL